MSEILIAWTNDFEISIPEIDQQHKKLVALLNDLYAKFQEDETDKEYLIKLLIELYDYTDYHFESKEKFYHKKESDKSRVKKHIQEHKKFLSNVLAFKRKVENGEDDFTLELMFFLKDWVIEHIMYNDKKLINAIKKDNNPFKEWI